MFNSTKELKEFLEWSKDLGISSIKVDGVEVEFSASIKNTTVWDPTSLEVTEDADGYDEKILFHSSEG